jgi:hypothetical protein
MRTILFGMLLLDLVRGIWHLINDFSLGTMLGTIGPRIHTCMTVRPISLGSAILYFCYSLSVVLAALCSGVVGVGHYSFLFVTYN